VRHEPRIDTTTVAKGIVNRGNKSGNGRMSRFFWEGEKRRSKKRLSERGEAKCREYRGVKKEKWGDSNEFRGGPSGVEKDPQNPEKKTSHRAQRCSSHHRTKSQVIEG